METVSHPPGGVQSPRFTCPVGIRRHEFWNPLPASGCDPQKPASRKLEVTEDVLRINGVRHLLPRVVKARSESKATADFTADELRSWSSFTTAPTRFSRSRSSRVNVHQPTRF